MNYRGAEAKDIPVLANLRKKQLIDEGQKPDPDLDYELTDYFKKKCLTDLWWNGWQKRTRGSLPQEQSFLWIINIM